MPRTTAALTSALLLALGCGRRGTGGPSRVPVTIAHAAQRAVPFELLATGTVEPRQNVEVQAQVTGVLTQVTFHEGDEVAAGQVLFQIEPRPFQAALEQAKGMLAWDRSEEHTSELQSRLHLVCRLLLEKKKKKALVTTRRPAHADISSR